LDADPGVRGEMKSRPWSTDLPIVDDHPQKIRVDDVAVDGSLGTADGWVNMAVQFLVTKDTVGSEHAVLGYTTMPPGARHEIHRHPHAEEIVFLTAGEGLYLLGETLVRMRPGDVALSKVDEPHGFWNTSETETARMVWAYGGAASLADAGYVLVGELGPVPGA
jgi:quercetin dioxygenase-like cupin family protein